MMFLCHGDRNPITGVAYSTVLIYSISVLLKKHTTEGFTMTAFTQTGTMINPELLGSGRIAKKASLKGDIALVAFWAALVPGLMWFGAMVGF